MAYTRVWSETRPDGALVNASQIDDEMRFTRVDFRERVAGIFGLNAAEFAADPIVPKTLGLSTSFAVAATARMYVDGVAATGDTYIYEQAANMLSLVAGGVEMFRVQNGTINSFATSFQIQSANKFYVDGGGDSYLWENGANNVEMFAGGTRSMGWASTGAYINATNKFWVDNGGDTFISEPSANILRLTVGNVAVLNAASTYFDIRIDAGVPATNKFFFDGGSDSYIHESSANTMSFVAGGITGLRLTATQVRVGADMNNSTVLIGDAGASAALSFFGAAAVTKRNITGSRGGNAALASFLSEMAAQGLITNSTTA